MALALLTPVSAPAAERAVQFNQKIRPVLSENCFACHGPDPGSRKAGLRLDTKESLFGATRDDGPVVTPGDPEKSVLWRRITTKDEDDLMPPPKSHKVLKPEEKDAIRKWISQGANWQPHWSLNKPERPDAPAARVRKGSIRNPIDTFVAAKLAEKAMKMNPEADRRTLARRLALDLTGLPPKPSEVEAFVRDRSSDYYEKFVQKLIGSPAFGEHRARYWLDAARYADTHGLHFDNYREMWPYRDWVIAAFNRNMPFDQFTIEQLAGDLLENPTREQLIATGFQRCNMTTNEGGTIEEENLVNYASDRVTAVSWVWLGMTANCAACHDHKFDPISTRDFYSMAAFFRNTTQSGFDGNVKEGANAFILVPQTPEDTKRWESLPSEIDGAKALVETRRKEADAPFTSWVSSFKPNSFQDQIERDLALRVALTNGSGDDISAERDGKSVSFKTTGTVAWKENGKLGTSLHFEKDGTVDLADAGDFDLGQPFSCGGWVYVPEKFDGQASIVARMDEGNQHRGWDLWIQGTQFAAHIVNEWPKNALKIRTGDGVAKKGKWQHVFVTFDGSGKPEGLRIFVNGVVARTEVENTKKVEGSIRTTVPLRLGRRHHGAHFTGGAVQDFRLYSRVIPPADMPLLMRATDLPALLAKPLGDWPAEARNDFFEYFLGRNEPYQQARSGMAKLESERDKIQSRNPVTHIQKEKKDTMPVAFVLSRGQYDKPKDKVTAATIASLPPLPEGAPLNRLGLARWLVSPENPLAARVTVNRFWQEVFGTGIVKTTEDFGIMGDKPANLELLDWLAVEFVESGWDVKRLFTLMVTSAAYRQDSRVTPEKLELDPANRLLSRGPRFRMDAEMIRDYALAASGLLNAKIGGPSVKPYQPDGVWEAVAMPESNTRNYKRDAGEALYRRSLYTFWKRAAPPAAMDVFNAPSRETCTVRRERTNTPLQALATLNDIQFVEASRHLAEEALRCGNCDNDQAVAEIAARVLSRPLSSKEKVVVLDTLKRLDAFYAKEPEEAQKLINVGEAKPDSSIPAPKLAALTMVANQLLNMDEALNK